MNHRQQAKLSFDQYRLISRRLDEAHCRGQTAVQMALARITLRHEAEGSELLLSEYIGTGAALIEHTEARLVYARTVLPEFVRECRTLGFSGRDLGNIVEDEIQGLCYSMELPELFRQALNLEYAIPCSIVELSSGIKAELREKAEPPQAFADATHEEHMKLLNLVLGKISIETWLRDNRGINRTQLYDYRAGRLQGKISAEKRSAIEAAIKSSVALHSD